MKMRPQRVSPPPGLDLDLLKSEKSVRRGARQLVDFAKSHGWRPAKTEDDTEDPKSWFVDPFTLIDMVGLGYRETPGTLTFDTLQQMTHRNPVVAAIVQTRIQQVASFCQPQPNQYSVGYKISPKDRRTKLTDSGRKRITYIQNFIANTGSEYSKQRDNFKTFIQKFVRDSLTWDQATFEKTRGLALSTTGPGKLLSFYATPSATIRIAKPKDRKGRPEEDEERARKMVKYVQVINGRQMTSYSSDRLAFCVRNPRTDIDVFGYGYTELEMLLNTITAHLWAEEWNRKMFSQGSTIKGMFNIKGNISPVQMESFKRQWLMQIAGIAGAHKTPFVNAEGIEFIPLQLSNTEMGYQMWLEYLIKVACSCFLMDPAEINFDLRGGAGVSQPMFMTTNEAQQKVSKDRGLRPLLGFVADSINRHIVWEIDDKFEFEFVGLDSKTEEQAIELRLKEVQNYKTINQIRQEQDMDPIEFGDIILNPTYTGYVQQKQAAQQPQPGMPGQGGAPPGGAPQQPGAAPQVPSTEYRPNALTQGGKPKDFGDEEDEAQQALQQHGGEASAKTPARDEESSSDISDVRSEDWETTLRSMPTSNLRKGHKVKDKAKAVVNPRSWFIDI